MFYFNRKAEISRSSDWRRNREKICRKKKSFSSILLRNYCFSFVFFWIVIGFSLSYACFSSPNLLKVSECLEPEHEPLQQSNNTHLMACWAHFHWVAFPSHALAGQLNEHNVISSEEIGLNSSDLTRLWLHKSATDLGSAERTLATGFPNCSRMLGIKNLDSWTNALHPSTSLFCFTTSFSLQYILGQHLLLLHQMQMKCPHVLV